MCGMCLPCVYGLSWIVGRECVGCLTSANVLVSNGNTHPQLWGGDKARVLTWALPALLAWALARGLFPGPRVLGLGTVAALLAVAEGAGEGRAALTG